jgi:hypothetical protein
VRGAEDATASTGPTKYGPGPAVAGIFPTARVRWVLFLAGQGALGAVFGARGAGPQMLLPLRGLLDTAQGTVERLFGRGGGAECRFCSDPRAARH